MFDDTYRHSVLNDTDGERVVLFMDIVRPLKYPVSSLNHFLMAAVRKSSNSQDARKSQEAWEKKFEKPEKKARQRSGVNRRAAYSIIK